MVKKIYNNYYGNSNYAGARPMGWKPKGVVLHNTAGTYNGDGDKALDYNHGNLATYAHYYCDKDYIVQVCDTRYGAWHTGTDDGNMNYVGYEICESKNKADFLENEKAACRQVAEDLKFWGLPANRNTVLIHQLVPGAASQCPWLSVKYHGGARATQDYFIKLIKQYMAEDSNEEKPQPPKNPTYWHSDKVKAVKVLNEIGVYDGKFLSTSKTIGKLKVGEEVKVLDIWMKGKGKHDMSRLKIQFKGKTAWITGNAYYVESCYYLTGDGKKIKATKDGNAYPQSNLTGKPTKYKKGDVFNVVDNVADKNGYARFKLKSGQYVTARRDFWKFV